MALNIKRKQPKRNLVYTVAFDAPGSQAYRFLAKMLASSLLRTFFTGDILIFRNSAAPLFLVERKGLEEMYLETPPMYGQERAEYSWSYKHRVAELIDPELYDKILFLDADCLALRNIDHLLEGDWDIRCQPERGLPMNTGHYNALLTGEEMTQAAQRDGINSGTLAVRAAVFHEVMREWGRLDAQKPLRETGFHDQASWNKLVLNCEMDGGAGIVPAGNQGAAEMKTGPANAGGTPAPSSYPWRAEAFPAGEIMFPCFLDPHYATYTKAALTHNLTTDTLEKVEFTFGLYMRTFFCDPQGLFFNLLEM